MVSTVLKLTPEKWLEKLPKTVDEDKGVDPNNKFLAAYNQQAQAKVAKK